MVPEQSLAKREGPAWTRLSQQGKTRLTGCSTALMYCQASSWPQTGFISLCLQQVRCTEGCARAQRALESTLCRTAFPTASYRQSFFCLKGWFWGPPYGLRGRRHRQLHPSIWLLSWIKPLLSSLSFSPSVFASHLGASFPHSLSGCTTTQI